MGGGLTVRLCCWVAALLLAALPAWAQRDVVFEADLRAEISAGRFDPERDTLGLRGAVPPMSWHSSLPMRALGDGRYTLAVRFAEGAGGGQPLQHKFRRERPGQGDDEGWEPGRNRLAWIDGPTTRVARVFGAQDAPRPARYAGTVLQIDPGPVRIAPPRPVWVWLPPGYEREPQRRYPVLYLLDGQNVFDPAEAGAEWQVDETAQRGVLAGTLQPRIIVAVPSGRGRLHEYTPTPGWVDAARRGEGGPAQRTGGGGPVFVRYLLDELKPVIDARFRTRPERASTALGGSSLGGLLALWAALHHGDRIGAALVVSPSVWWDEGFAERDARQAPLPVGPRPRLWLHIGGREGPGAVPAVQRLRDVLRERGWRGTDLAYSEVPDAGHDEVSWAARVEDMLKFLDTPDSAAPAR